MRARVIVLFFIGAFAAASAFAQGAGRVLATVDDAWIMRETKRIPALLDAEVRSGDVLYTGPKGSLRLRMADASLISLRAETQFRIDQFIFSGREDGTERAFFSLLKGGLRTVTGAIGRESPGNYRLSTPVAALSLRGTQYTAMFCSGDDCPGRDGLYGGVLEGRVVLVNQAGIEREFRAGAYFFVRDVALPAERMISPPPFLRQLETLEN